MHTAYVVVTLLAVVANLAIALADVLRAKFVLANSASVGVPESWLVPLGLVKAAGAAGLVLGLLGVPLIGTVAAAGLVLFFVGAVLTHLRARNYALGFPGVFLALAAGAFVLSLA
ncbi:DoxX family protein [Pseudonocardia sp. DSM 110487]|uniref:DoxX family protein n=1 Tax=Pseudonocardia sp. DSM 110487 TaxID=2865833 RepID=UPI001C699B30|nr:DoxX family protein [Pseudonocardia sp. DSM 110487]QYN37924.1 DoxX family protein [Pseudonocardia sp. DSM 110487]